MKLLLLILALLPASFGIRNLGNYYPFNTTLKEGDYYLFWNFSKSDVTIQFAVRVKTTGWIGFGISPNGQMPGSDVIIGWIDEDKSYFHDRFALGRFQPPIDPIQDWSLTEAEQEDGYTQLEFNRKFITCDEDRDREILEDTSRIVYSLNDNKPTVTQNPDGSESYSINQHQEQGSTSLNLRGGLPTPPDIPSDAQTFTVNVEEVTIPATETTYYCKAIELDESIRNNEKYIVKFEPYLSSSSKPYVHHMLIYICDGLEESDLGAGGNCDNGAVSDRVSQCLASLLIAAWAVGGSDFIYPENVAFPIGGPNDKQYAVIQIHYNNPNRNSGVVDSSGITFTYIDSPREHNAGIMFFGHSVISLMAIPPNADNYTITAFCSSACTEKYLPNDGIHIFANMLHTHTIGTGLGFSVVQQTSCPSTPEFQTRDEQSQIIEKNLHYDFNFQQANHLNREIIVRPGDTMLLNCYYNNTVRTETTLGGESTQDEMCLSFPVYYPKIAMSQCTSQPTFENVSGFIDNYVPEEYRSQFREIKMNSDPAVVKATFDLLEWNDKQIEGLYNSIYTTGDQYSICDVDDHFDVTEKSLPNICCNFEEEDQCTGTKPTPCCERTCTATPDGACVIRISLSLLFVLLLIITFVLFI